MIYLDSSVVLAEIFAENRLPPPSFWQQSLTSSRLLMFEVWNRIHAKGNVALHAGIARSLLEGVELTQHGRVMPFPPAEFSPFATTTSRPCVSRNLGSSLLTARRPGCPTG